MTSPFTDARQAGGRAPAGVRTAVCAVAAALLCAVVSGRVAAVETTAAESMGIDDARRIAIAQRPEVRAAQARTLAARQRPAIVSALDDPMVAPSIDHYPDEAMMPEEGEDAGRRYDWSVAVEQRFPLSNQLAERRRGAEFEAQRLDADAERVQLDVGEEAERAFVMLHERRQMAVLAAEQRLLAQQLVDASGARYAAGGGSQAEVLRAEVEVARAQATLETQIAGERAASAMFNASLGRDPEDVAPRLRPPAPEALPPAAAAVREAALRRRPELRGGTAEVGRSRAEVGVMRSMYWPMGMVRLGRASTMAEGKGTMAMVGISLPIWTAKLRAGVAEAEAMETMARADVEAMRRMIEAEAAAARESVLAARVQYLALRDDIVPRARMALSPALSGYAAGRGSLVSVIEATQALRMAQIDQVMGESALALAWARLRRATGGDHDTP